MGHQERKTYNLKDKNESQGYNYFLEDKYLEILDAKPFMNRLSFEEKYSRDYMVHPLETRHDILITNFHILFFNFFIVYVWFN